MPKLGTTGTFADIEVIETLDPFLEALKRIEPKTLVLFDIDEVLIKPTDNLIKMHNRPIFSNWINKLKATVGVEQAEILRSHMMSQRKLQLVDKRTPDLIRQLIRRKIDFVCLTRSWSGKYGIIPDTPIYRLMEMKVLGYDLNHTFKHLEQKYFNELGSEKPGKYPEYKMGIIWCCDHTKGDVINAFFNYAKYKPEKIIFIDDKTHNLTSVSQYAHAKGIAFEGYQYKAAHLEPSDVNMKMAEIQMKTLIETQRWLSDEEVRLLGML